MGSTVWQRLRDIGDVFNPGAIQATLELFAPLALTPQQAGAVVERDLRYGSDVRHRLDVFHSPGSSGRPVVVFIHGGGFAAGDKGEEGKPFYNNVGAWAVRSGFVGVTVTYRHAPVHTWPSGAADVAGAVQWLHAHIAEFGGDADRIVLVGQSAGGAHVAGFLAGHGQPAAGRPRVKGAVLLSGIYEPDAHHVNPMHEVYFGSDRAVYAARSAVPGLASTTLPCLFTISEFDPPQFHAQLAAVFAATVALRGRCPQVLWLQGHNHVSSSLQLGTGIDTLGPSLAGFVQRIAG